MIVWGNDSDTIILKPIEIRSKRGVKKMKKTNSAIYIPNMDAKEFDKICAEKGWHFIYTQVQPHGRLIDEAALWVEINKICDRRDAGIITDLTCLQQILSALRHAPTIIPAEGGET